MTVVEWLTHETQKVLCKDTGNSYFTDRAAMAWGIAESYAVCKRSPQWMNDSQLAELRFARDCALYNYLKLSKLAREDNSVLYPIRPKIHVYDECIHECLVSSENPAALWTFQDEDNMRVMVNIAASCHGSTLEETSLEKWVLQFFASAEECSGSE